MQPSSRELFFAVQHRLEQIEELVGQEYSITLVARYVGKKPLSNADIIFTLDDLSLVKASIDKMKDRKPTISAGEKWPQSLG